MRPTNSVIYGTLRYTLQAICCCASYILLNRLWLVINSEFSRLGLGINFIQWIALTTYNDTQFVAVALFVVTPAFRHKGGDCSVLPELSVGRKLATVFQLGNLINTDTTRV